jgi:hypothetical protein
MASHPTFPRSQEEKKQMTMETVSGIVSCLLLIGGLGWKLNAELSSIRVMLQVFMAKSEAKWQQVDKLEKRVEHLEKKVLMKNTGSF